MKNPITFECDACGRTFTEGRCAVSGHDPFCNPDIPHSLVNARRARLVVLLSDGGAQLDTCSTGCAERLETVLNETAKVVRTHLRMTIREDCHLLVKARVANVAPLPWASVEAAPPEMPLEPLGAEAEERGAIDRVCAVRAAEARRIQDLLQPAVYHNPIVSRLVELVRLGEPTERALIRGILALVEVGDTVMRRQLAELQEEGAHSEPQAGGA